MNSCKPIERPLIWNLNLVSRWKKWTPWQTKYSLPFSPRRTITDAIVFRYLPAPVQPPTVVINELMAINDISIADPQGEYDDWVELHNLTSQRIDLSGHFLSDTPDNLRRWRFPNGTTIGPNDYLIVWTDGDEDDRPGLHTNFRLSGDGEVIFLIGPDSRGNPVIDFTSFGEQTDDVAIGRHPNGTGQFRAVRMTPGMSNQ